MASIKRIIPGLGKYCFSSIKSPLAPSKKFIESLKQ